VTDRMHQILRYAARAILLTVAFLYFLVDLIFFSIMRPLRKRLMALNWVKRLREWAGRLNRYSALLLLVVPWLILEPIKPIGFVLFTHKHHFTATILIVGGEVVKLTLFEQLFDMVKPNLMSFRWFAWCYCNGGRLLSTCDQVRCGEGCLVCIALYERGYGIACLLRDRTRLADRPR
jgi:hypothetical protein